jgi:hypothetical protein
MKIKTKIDFNQYLKLQYIITYSNIWMIWVSICGTIMFIYAVLGLTRVVPAGDNIYLGLAFGFYVLLLPYFIFRVAKKNYNTHKNLQDDIEYEFLRDKFLVTTPYSNGEFPWERIYKIKEFKIGF